MIRKLSLSVKKVETKLKKTKAKLKEAKKKIKLKKLVGHEIVQRIGFDPNHFTQAEAQNNVLRDFNDFVDIEYEAPRLQQPYHLFIIIDILRFDGVEPNNIRPGVRVWTGRLLEGRQFPKGEVMPRGFLGTGQRMTTRLLRQRNFIRETVL